MDVRQNPLAVIAPTRICVGMESACQQRPHRRVGELLHSPQSKGVSHAVLQEPRSCSRSGDPHQLVQCKAPIPNRTKTRQRTPADALVVIAELLGAVAEFLPRPVHRLTAVDAPAAHSGHAGEFSKS